MPPSYHVGQRLSFESQLCTVRYYGPVQGGKGIWIGVEWDDITRGKHNGESKGIRYFTCLSSSPSAASFIRPDRRSDLERDFLGAVHEKYATGVTDQLVTVPVNKQIEISGKVVQEVGFEKIRQQLAQLHELKIIIVDGLRIKYAVKPTDQKIKDVCPKIVELDLSRNLFEDFEEVARICSELNNLRRLKLNGNRFSTGLESSISSTTAFKEVVELSIDEMLLCWNDLASIAEKFDSLRTLTASSNELPSIPQPIKTHKLEFIKLEYNKFTSLSGLAPLAELKSLKNLHLKGNIISAITSYSSIKPPIFGTNLRYVDLSYNQITSWSFIDDLVTVFPGLQDLRLSHNPIYGGISEETGPSPTLEETYMFTVARLGNLQTLNFSKISPAERANAEMFYLSRISKELSEVPESEEHNVIARHKRYHQLCEIYGTPATVRKGPETINPDFLEARLIKFTFYMPAGTQTDQDEAITKEAEIPKSFDIYRVKGIVGRIFGVAPLKVRLIWETGEWDPVAGYEEAEDSDDEDVHDENKKITIDTATEEIVDKGKWMKREVEVEESLRQVGFCVDGTEVQIRVELRK